MKLKQMIQRARCDTVPAGWFTNDQLAKREGYSNGETAHESIKQAVRLRILRVKNFRVMWGGSARLRPHYRYR